MARAAMQPSPLRCEHVWVALGRREGAAQHKSAYITSMHHTMHTAVCPRWYKAPRSMLLSMPYPASGIRLLAPPSVAGRAGGARAFGTAQVASRVLAGGLLGLGSQQVGGGRGVASGYDS